MSTHFLRPSIGLLAWRACRNAAAAWRNGRAEWQRLREAQRTASALRGLDDRMLQDIGIARCEATSLALELAGVAPPQREQALRRDRGGN